MVKLGLAVGWLPMAMAAEGQLESQVRNALMELSQSTHADVAVYNVRFGLLVTNRSDRNVRIPAITGGGSETTRDAVLSVQRREADGSWKFLSQESFYGTERTKYVDCVSLGPGATAEIKGLVDVLPLLKARATELGRERL